MLRKALIAAFTIDILLIVFPGGRDQMQGVRDGATFVLPVLVLGTIVGVLGRSLFSDIRERLRPAPPAEPAPSDPGEDDLAETAAEMRRRFDAGRVGDTYNGPNQPRP